MEGGEQRNDMKVSNCGGLGWARCLHRPIVFEIMGRHLPPYFVPIESRH